MNAQNTAKLLYFAILWAFVVFEVLFQYRAYQETGILGIYHKDLRITGWLQRRILRQSC